MPSRTKTPSDPSSAPRGTNPLAATLSRRRLGAAAALACLGAAGPFAARAQGRDIVVGQLVSLSNPANQATSAELAAGVDVAVSQANAAGGIHGSRVKVVRLDDGFDPAKTVALAETLVRQHGASALVACLGTQTLLRLVQERVLENHQLASFGPFTGLRRAQAAPNVFPVRASFDDEAKAMFAHAVGLGRKKVAFLYLKAGAGPDLSQLAPGWAMTLGATLVANTGLDIRKTAAEQRQESESALAAWTGTPDAVVLIGFGGAQSSAIAALRRRYGAWLPIYALGQVNVEALVSEIGPEAARGLSLTQVMPSPSSVDKRICREFSAERLRFKPELQPTYMMLEGYVAARVMLEAVRRAKSPTREAVLQAALAAGDMDVADFRVSYSPASRKSLQPVDITLLDRQGRLIR